MQIEYTYFGGPAEYVIHAIKANLTGSLRSYSGPKFSMIARLTIPASFTPLLHGMVKRNMPKILGGYKGMSVLSRRYCSY